MISTREESFLLLFFSCIKAFYENRQKHWLLAKKKKKTKEKKVATSLFIGNLHFLSFGKRFLNEITVPQKTTLQVSDKGEFSVGPGDGY